MKIFVKTVAIISCLILAACSGGPGAPKLANSNVIYDCQNVVSNATSGPFITGSYLTTWGSAYREGANAGVREGANQGGGVGGALILSRVSRPEFYRGRPIVHHTNPTLPYCMVIAASPTKTRLALKVAFSQLKDFGYRTNFSPEPRPYGTYTTNLVERSHRAARWIDRFSATVEALPSGNSAIVVWRQVYIDRDGSGYYEASSVGALETWVMVRARQLATSQ